MTNHYLTEVFKDRMYVHVYILYTAHIHTHTEATAGSCGYVQWEHQLWSKIFLELFVQFNSCWIYLLTFCSLQFMLTSSLFTNYNYVFRTLR